MNTSLNPDALAQLIMWEELPFGGNPDNYIRLDANAAHAVIKLLQPHLAAAPPEVTSAKASAWEEGFQAGWEEHEDLGAVVNDFWDAKTPNPYLPEKS